MHINSGVKGLKTTSWLSWRGWVKDQILIQKKLWLDSQQFCTEELSKTAVSKCASHTYLLWLQPKVHVIYTDFKRVTIYAITYFTLCNSNKLTLLCRNLFSCWHYSIFCWLFFLFGIFLLIDHDFIYKSNKKGKHPGGEYCL